MKSIIEIRGKQFSKKKLNFASEQLIICLLETIFFFFHIEKQHIFFIIFLVVYTLQFQIIGYRVGGGGVLIKGGARQINETSINERAPSKREGDV